MGTWGTSLYANDSASDVRSDYLEKLKQGKTNEQATNELLDEYKDILSDQEEGSLFWFALADTQWDYGRLLPNIKEMALLFLTQETNYVWNKSQEATQEWARTLKGLAEKLRSPMPKEKKVSGYRLYHCTWKQGDVFVYRLTGNYSKEKGLYGKHILFQKVANEIVWPGHTLPIIRVYKWMGDGIPTLNTVGDLPFLVLNMMPATLVYKPHYERKYAITLMSTAKRELPEENITYLGNCLDSLCAANQQNIANGCMYVGWVENKYNRYFEKYVIDHYLAWEDVE